MDLLRISFASNRTRSEGDPNKFRRRSEEVTNKTPGRDKETSDVRQQKLEKFFPNLTTQREAKSLSPAGSIKYLVQSS